MKKLFFLMLIAIATTGLTSNKSLAQAKALTSVGDESPYYKFASLVHTANLDATLIALGNYTIFAQPNLFFRDMSAGKMDSLTSDPAKLAMILKAHIIKGKIAKKDITLKLTAGKGKATFINLLGQPLKLSLNKDKQLMVTDSKGNHAYFVDFDAVDPHAIIHGIDNILM